MATIGTFTKQENGGFIGTLQTLTIQSRVTFEPQEKRTDSSPHFRVISGLAEFGAAWEHDGKNGPYLSVLLDDPSFPAPIYCRFFKTNSENGFSLVWDRPKQPKAS